MSKRLRSLLLIFSLSSALTLTFEIDAYEPSVTIGKPSLQDILYSPDGRFLATLTRSCVELLDAETFAPVTRVPVMYGKKLAFSPDSSLLAIFRFEGGIQIWHVDSETFLANIPLYTEVGAFSPDGKYLAYAKGDSVFLWDIDQRRITFELTGDPQKSIQYPQRVTGIAFHPNSKILAVGSYRHTIALWDIETGKVHSYLEFKEDYPIVMSFSHDGNFLAAVVGYSGDDRYNVRLWNVSTGDSRSLIGYFSSLVFTPDDLYLLAGGSNGNLHIIKVDTFKVERKPAVDHLPPDNVHNPNRLERLTFHPDGWKLAILINYSRICIWNAQSLSRSQTIYGYGCCKAEAVYLPEINRIVTGVDSDVLSFWDATTGELLKATEFYAPIDFLEASHDAKEIAVILNHEARIWNASAMEQLRVFPYVGIVTRGIEFSPSGRYLATLRISGISIWDTETGEEVSRIRGSDSDRSLLLYTPDEKQILTIPRGQEKTVFWDVDTGEPADEIGYAGPLVNVGFDFVQARAVEEGIETRLLKSNKLLSQIPVELEIRYPQQFFQQVKFHPSGNVLAIRYQDDMEPGECGFYSSHTGELISSVSDIRYLQFTPDGRYIFMVDDEWQLGLYLTSDVLGKSISSAFAVHPSGKKITTLGHIKRNQLLQNYPNPCNPETWIPYHLEKDSEVTIRIYNPTGELIRILPLGTKSAGAYLTNSEAAHWDGKNEKGEQAASGVYFYTIQAGEFTATKKMVIADRKH